MRAHPADAIGSSIRYRVGLLRRKRVTHIVFQAHPANGAWGGVLLVVPILQAKVVERYGSRRSETDGMQSVDNTQVLYLIG